MELNDYPYFNDTLCSGYLCRTIEQPNDYNGRVVCTIIKKEASHNLKRAIVYVHGYNDYFFQTALGDSAVAHGYNFYAVDLRRYGRSLLPHQDPFYCKKLDEYFADIDTTIAIAKMEGNEQIVLMAHSTGGLTSSLYLGKMKKEASVNALILNSPFLDWNLSRTMEGLVMPVVSCLGSIFTNIKVQGAGKVPCGYAQSLLKEYKGEWEYNTDWKKSCAHPKRSGWVRAIHHGQKKAHKGLAIDCPILVMSSDRSVEETDDWQEDFRRADVVLDVDEIQSFGSKLGKNVTHSIIKGGKHDLILSEEDARNETYKVVFEWIEKTVPRMSGSQSHN